VRHDRCCLTPAMLPPRAAIQPGQHLRSAGRACPQFS
jgi:hypothetical protein